MTHRIRLHAGWVAAGRRWVRRFGRPTGTDGATLHLVGGVGPAWLNGDPLGGWPADVTGRLLPRNELVMQTGATTDVALEIHPQSPPAATGGLAPPEPPS